MRKSEVEDIVDEISYNGIRAGLSVGYALR